MAAIPSRDDVDWQSIKTLVFGEGVQESVLERWLQPFSFSLKEPAALLQQAGGPCAVLAPLQAFLLKKCLQNGIPCLTSLTAESVRTLLAGALCDILVQCRGEEEGRPLLLARVGREVADMLEEGQETSSKRMRVEVASSSLMADLDMLHTCLMVETFASGKELGNYLEDNFSEVFGTNYDVLSVLYSVVLTKGPDLVIKERQDEEEALIDPVHGHGSQSLINLLLTGSATPNVFDGTKDLCGLALQGIQSQSSVGFLSYLECLRYLEVGRHLKQPVWPVWVLGSETHLTVLFSRDLSLVRPPTARQKAADVFNKLDGDRSGFIPSTRLSDLMAELELFSEQSYLDIMLRKLDSDGLGVVLKQAFLDEFFPTEKDDLSGPDSFTVFHYNGLARTASPVTFVQGEAVLLEGMSGVALDSNAILQTMQTKWKNLAVDWVGGIKPSIN